MKRFLFSLVILTCSTFCSFTQGRIVIEHGPYLQNLCENKVTIVWVSDKPSVGWVELLPDDGTDFYLKVRSPYYDAVNGIKNISRIHAVKIEGLRTGTRYRYRVYVREVLSHKGAEVIYGSATGTDVFTRKPLSFITNDENKKEFSFAMINDIHGRTGDIGRLMKVVNDKKMDFMIYNGDMSSIFDSEKQVFSDFMDTTVTLFAKEKAFYYVRGNHETRGPMASSFQSYFSPKEPHLYYMFRQGSVCFIVLDSGEDKPDSDIEYYGITDYDRYRSEEARWLSKVLGSEECLKASVRVVICHIPPTFDRDAWHGQQEVMDKFVPLLNKAHVDVMLCGHLHRYVKIKPSEGLRFPIIVNSYNTVLEGTVSDKNLIIRVMDKEGEVIDTEVISK